jgi:hypothetical protein
VLTKWSFIYKFVTQIWSRILNSPNQLCNSHFTLKFLWPSLLCCRFSSLHPGWSCLSIMGSLWNICDIFQVYILGYYPYSEDSCRYLGMFRNLIAFADFTSLGVISVCVYSHKTCRTCHDTGTITAHQHHDRIFGGRRIFGVCLLIWVFAFLYIALDIFNVIPSMFYYLTCFTVNDCRWQEALVGQEDSLGVVLYLTPRSTLTLEV